MTLAVLMLPCAAEEETLRQQLLQLSRQENLSISGLEAIEDEPMRPLMQGTLRERLRSLLEGYNYVLVNDASGGIGAVRILGRQRISPRDLPSAASTFTIRTTKRGGHHEVEAVLAGPTGAWQRLPLIVDTGASAIVLPASSIGALGFPPQGLIDGWAETAGGVVRMKSGRLASVTVGAAHQRDVEVAFIDDQQIGRKALLGMSFLDRYRLTLDDANSRIVLEPK